MPTYLHPGVYVEEIPSGSRPIEGVSTSNAAFVGAAYRGPVGKAELVHSFDEFKEIYGGIEKKAAGDALGEQENAMVLAVRSFYMNGGKNAYICRLAKGGTSVAAFKEVAGEHSGGNVLKIEASSVGAWGNKLYIRILKPDVDQAGFDVEIGHHDGDGKFVMDEEFTGVTLNSQDDDYILTRINDVSGLIKVSLLDAADPEHASNQYEKATLTGGQMDTSANFFNTSVADSMSMRIDIDRRGPKLITIKKADLEAEGDWNSNNEKEGKVVAAHVQKVVRDLGGYTGYLDFTCEYKDVGGLSKFVLTSGMDADISSVQVLDGDESSNDLAQFLRLDSAQKATHTGGAVAAGTNVRTQFQTEMVLTMNLDGKGEQKITIKKEDIDFTDNDVSNRVKIADAIQAAVQQHQPKIPSFAEFTCEYDDTARKFTFTSGSSASRTSSITINGASPAGNTNFASLLKLTTNPVAFSGRTLQDGTWKVIPKAASGIGDNGEQLTSGSAEAPEAPDYGSFFTNVLRKVRDVSILLLPGMYWNKELGNIKISHALAHCESTKSRVLIVDPPKDVELEQGAQVQALGLPTSTYSVLYYPWVEVPNPLYNADTAPNEPKTLKVGPGGFAAGMWAKIDGTRGVWKAPAGTEAQIIGLAGLQYQVEDGEQDQLNPLGVNCFRKQPGYGNVIWGSRTLSTKANPEWRYVPVRRTAIYIEQSIYNGIQWAVFEPNDEPLWSSLRGNIGDFMNGMFRSGAFQGTKASDAYFVRCGKGDTMTQGDIDRGQVIVLVGFAPLKPAEFVIVRIQQKVQQ
ncbi:conserved hypothetical protein [Nitrospina gracilis 3/211]|uniref:Phage tail sheath protein n=1 Tax=Nitrospina gracilis (strain 3/211) TaxID=1266370 RepID=M1YXK8_NITG3|nr:MULTISPECIES: phage tail sheath C-terminal domain-containing protein [Nitrospina]MCF8723369.1 phage tail sheath protein FI [Nitrospina sp. Nb-3]CCQ90424.1 conserved hypothetical protein [Nitrospina gracilis 3/211]